MKSNYHRRYMPVLFWLIILALCLMPFYIAAEILTNTSYGFASPEFHRAHTRIHGIDYSYYNGSNWVFERDGEVCKVWSEKWKR